VRDTHDAFHITFSVFAGKVRIFSEIVTLPRRKSMEQLSMEIIGTGGKCEIFPRALYNIYTVCSMLLVRRFSFAKFLFINDGENKTAGLKRNKGKYARGGSLTV
jgi:hypothetical protein